MLKKKIMAKITPQSPREQFLDPPPPPPINFVQYTCIHDYYFLFQGQVKLRHFLGRVLWLGQAKGAERRGQDRLGGWMLRPHDQCKQCTLLIGGSGSKNRSLRNYPKALQRTITILRENRVCPRVRFLAISPPPLSILYMTTFSTIFN